MANKKSQGRGNAKPQGGRPNWTPYLVAAVVVLVAMAVYSAIYSVPRASENASSARRRSARDTARGVPSVEQLEAQLRNLHAGLAGVAGKGETGVFQRIGGMAATIQDALDRAANATSEEEQREILEAGLASKADMLAALADRTKTLREEEAADQKQHAPVMLDPNGHVAKLTKDTFGNFLAARSRNMVEFYAPWCGHCKKFAPQYEKFAEQFQGRAGFAAVDATAETQLARIYSVGGYPTLKWFVHGRPINYEGQPKDLAKWVEDRLRPAYQELDDEEDLASSLQAALSTASGAEKSGIQMAICAGSGPKKSNAFRAFEIATERFRGKMLFIWSPKEQDNAEEFEVVTPNGLKVRDAPDLNGKDIAVKQTGAIVVGVADKDWLKLRNEPGYMLMGKGDRVFLEMRTSKQEPSMSLYRTGKDPEPCPGACDNDDVVVPWIEKALESAEVEDFDQD